MTDTIIIPQFVVIGTRCLCGKLKEPDSEWCQDCYDERYPDFHPAMPDEDAYREWRQTLIQWRMPE